MKQHACDIKIHNATLIPMDGRMPIENACVLILGDRVQYAGPAADAPLCEAKQSIDGKGGIVMPGFVNAHTHSSMTLLRGQGADLPLQRWLKEAIFPVEDRMQNEDYEAGALLAVAEMIASGTVCCNDMYMGEIFLARAIEKSGMRGVLSRSIACASTDDEEMERALDRQRAFAQEASALDPAHIQVAMAPHAEYTCSVPFIKRCIEEAHHHGWMFHIHASETQQEHEECVQRHGKTPVELLEELGAFEGRAILAHCVYVTPHDQEILAKHKVSVAHCPYSNLKLGSGIAPVVQMIQQGVNVCIGTDGAASNNLLDLRREAELASLLQKGVGRNAAAMDAETTLRCATVHGTQALWGVAGGLYAGAPADLILMQSEAPHIVPKTDPMDAVLHARCAQDVRLTMVAGKILYEAGEFFTLDIQEIRHRAESAAQRLCGK